MTTLALCSQSATLIDENEKAFRWPRFWDHSTTVSDSMPASSWVLATPEHVITTLNYDIISASAQEAYVGASFVSAVSELKRYESFPVGWDGYRAVSFASETLKVVEQFVQSAASFFHASRVAPRKITPGPCPDGSIDVEIICGERTLLANFSSDAKAVSIYSESPDEENEKSFSLEKTPLATKLHWLSGSYLVSVSMDSDK